MDTLYLPFFPLPVTINGEKDSDTDHSYLSCNISPYTFDPFKAFP